MFITSMVITRTCSCLECSQLCVLIIATSFNFLGYLPNAWWCTVQVK